MIGSGGERTASMRRVGWWTRLRQLLSEARWILLGVIWVGALILGYAGFSRFSADHALGWSAGDIFYRTLQLMLMESGSVTGSVNWMLEMARYLLPALTAYAAVQALVHLFRQQLQWVRLWRLRDHVIICGLGRKSACLADELLALGRRIVIIDNVPQSSRSTKLQKQGAILISGDAADRSVLGSARVQRARHLVCLLPEDRQNLQVALQAYELTRGRRSGKLTCILHLASTDLLNLIKRSELGGHADVPFQLETLNTYARAARLLVQEDPGWQSQSRSSPVPGSILVIGLGRLGEHLVLQSAYTWHTLKRPGRLNVTILDREAQEKTTRLRQSHAQLASACTLIPRPLDFGSTAALLDAVRAGKSAQRVYVCLSDPVLSLQVCLSLLQIPAYRKVPIHVRMERDGGLSGLLDSSLIGDSADNQITPFDQHERACSAEMVLGGLHELLARGLHELYVSDAGTSIQQSLWEGLPDEVKESNRRQAGRIRAVLDGAGYQVSPLQDWDAGKRSFSKVELRQMASMEHDLWCKEKRAAGWRFAPERDSARRTHPDLVAWEDLPESERQKNEAFIRRLPALLARLGFQIDRA